MKNEEIWSQEDDARLIELVAKGQLDWQIADALQRTIRAVLSRIYKLRLSVDKNPKPWTPKELEKVKSYLRKDKNAEEIARKLKRSFNSVASRIHHMKKRSVKERSYQRWTQEEEERLVKLVSALISPFEIAKQMNRTHASVAGRIQALKAKGVITKTFRSKPKKELINIELVKRKPKHKNINFVEEVDEKLRAFVTKKLYKQEMADMLGVSVRAVERRLKMLGLKLDKGCRSKYDKDKIGEIINMYKTKNPYQISRELNIPYPTVRYLLRQSGCYKPCFTRGPKSSNPSQEP